MILLASVKNIAVLPRDLFTIESLCQMKMHQWSQLIHVYLLFVIPASDHR